MMGLEIYRMVRREDAMIVSFREPTLDEILSEPITKAVMQADSVDSAELEAMLRYFADGSGSPCFKDDAQSVSAMK
jgi:hypothetical protein